MASSPAAAVSSTPAACTRRSRTGDRCYKASDDMRTWCPACVGSDDPAGPLPSWMGGTADRLAFLHDKGDDSHLEYRPGWQDAATVPTPIDEAESLGHLLGSLGQAAVSPSDYTAGERAAFRRGYEAGFRAYEDDSWELESARAMDYSEMVEAVGVFAARKAVTL